MREPDREPRGDEFVGSLANRHRTGILCATRTRALRATSSCTPPISYSTVPSFTQATQNSGSALPLPMRVSSGLEDTGLCGKIRM